MKKLLSLLLLFAVAALPLCAEDGEWFAGKLPDELITASGKKRSTANALKGKIVALYFSASWCGPCRGFTPQLIKFYRKVAKKKNLEIIFVSSDKNDSAMKQYMKKDKMPWLAIPFSAKERLDIKKALNVRGIPNLAVYDSEGKLLSKNGRWDVVLLGSKAVDAWTSPDYKAKTYNDYKNSRTSGKKSTKKKKR